MPSVLAPAFVVLAPIALVAVVVGILFVAVAYVVVVQPILDWLTRPGGGFFKRLVFWPVRKASDAVERFVRHHVAGLTRTLGASAPGVLAILNQATDVNVRLAGTLGDMAEQTGRALWTLRHVTVPRLITTALVPIRAQLQRHTGRLDALEDLNRRTAVVVGTGLRALPWGAPGTYVGNFQQWWNSYSHLWTQVFRHIQPRLNELRFQIVPLLQRQINTLETQVTRIREEALPAIRQRLGRIEDSIEGILSNPTTWVLAALGAGMLPALTAGGMRTALRNLTCRNTQTLARDVCATDERFLTDLLGGVLVFAIALNPREVAAAAGALTGILGGVIRETVDH